MSTDSRSTHDLLDEILCIALAVGLVLVALMPSLRGMSAIGWLPMWLVAMPAVAWWALHGFALPRRAAATVAASGHRQRAMRQVQPQARRAIRSARAVILDRAA